MPLSLEKSCPLHLLNVLGMISRFQRKIKILTHWKNCWENDPVKMEAARQLGVLAMQKSWEMRNDNLREILSSWPESLSKRDFRRLINDLISKPQNLRQKPHRTSSMINRVRSKGHFKFCKQSKKWINLTIKQVNTGQT